MKLIVAGSRTLGLQQFVDTAMNNACNSWLSEAHEIGPNEWKKILPVEIVSGGAQGVDFCGEMWARKHKAPLKVFNADWDAHGKKAGILRNIEMGNYADRLVAVWDGKSRGTKHMIDYMLSLGKPTYIRIVS